MMQPFQPIEIKTDDLELCLSFASRDLPRGMRSMQRFRKAIEQVLCEEYGKTPEEVKPCGCGGSG